ncbi:protein kinase-like domain, Concanavalin A-like lectin/glucanase domain protein [Artemisia annua]|uniref:Protein kinase-like domain, Concanavalin A-like lectin/glucanase domain protein n=1 Tax=Artemisia annua TaxID=35608 RepID=A0A2U1KZY3_ARTAN|nr:protein kinase-like domain, Concanavalin A-like lectin/glucanase domain protein [Artemisia annua]
MALPSEQLCRHYSLDDIRSATQNFNDTLVVGKGGFGKVYEGHIKIENSSSITVAIKRFESISNQGIPEFMAEIETLSKLRHAHLVSLLGYCNDDQEMIIVYEYMSRGSLYDHLHKSNTPLSWSQRLKISLGAARGLDYLHTGAGTKHGVVHRDVKSTNILLDEDWEAKISDFGLAKNFPINQSSTYVHTGIKGTFGYMDPEIFMTGKFTRKTDVFAFGVVMFELLSGRQAVHLDGDEDLSLAIWAHDCVKNRNLDEVVAVELRREVSTKSLKEFSQIAYRCLDSDPKERPTMSEVVVALQLLESSPEKFEDCAKPAGIFGLTWTMPSNYFALPKSLTKMSLKSIGDGYIKSLMNSNNNSDCSSSVPSEDSEVLPGNEQMQAQELKIFSYTDLERSTSKFKKCIFEVGQHCVFKGWVHERNYSPSKRGVGLAITVMYFEHRPKHVQLERELQVMGEFRHPNLQRLLGYCLEGEKFYLVHELIEKRTLKDYLKGSAQELPFIMRVKIAIGVVSGLVFLHHKQMIDEVWSLSTDYIRIDKDFNAKISYFDLARLVRRESVSGSGNSGAQCDIRDLGYLLMEMLRGKSMSKKEQINLGKRKHYLSGQISDMSDEMIRKVVDRRIKLSVPLTERSRELLYIIQNCIGQGYSLEQALDDLEQIYSRMTRK